MLNNTPKYFKDKWFNYYKREMESRGLVFTHRQFKRIEYGFAYKDWLEYNNKQNSLNDLFQYSYTDLISSLVCQESRLINLIQKDDIWIGKEIKTKKHLSHVDRWRTR